MAHVAPKQADVSCLLFWHLCKSSGRSREPLLPLLLPPHLCDTHTHAHSCQWVALVWRPAAPVAECTTRVGGMSPSRVLRIVGPPDIQLLQVAGGGTHVRHMRAASVAGNQNNRTGTVESDPSWSVGYHFPFHFTTVGVWLKQAQQKTQNARLGRFFCSVFILSSQEMVKAAAKQTGTLAQLSLILQKNIQQFKEMQPKHRRGFVHDLYSIWRHSVT